MGIIKNYIRNLENASDKLEVIAMKAIKDNKDFILSTLKHDQLGEGMDSFGRIVGEYAAKTEEVFAKQYPKPRTPKIYGRPYNFEWTGKFFDHMKLKASKEGYDIDSPMKAYLENIYDTKLTALTEENEKFVNEKIVTPALYEYIFQQMVIYS